jgi:FkbM family methyltransferase
MAQALKKLLTTLEKELIKNRLVAKIDFNLRLVPKTIMFLFLLPIYVLVRLPFLYSRIVIGAIDCTRLMVYRIRYFRSWDEYKKIVNQINQKVKWSHSWKTIMWNYLNDHKSIVNFRSQMKEKKELILFSPNQFSSYRAETIFTKEADTIQWIKRCGSHDSLFIDIGANIGIYTLFYLSYFSGKAIAVEPGFEHLSLLSRNLSVNNLSDRCTIIPLPIKHNEERTGIRFNLSDGPGPASKTEGYGGLNSRESLFFTSTINLSVLLANSEFLSEDNLQNLVVKIDVDGPEMEVFSGICDLLETCKKVSLMIEIQEENYAEVSKMLVDKGFTRKEPDYFGKSDVNTFWEKGS